VASADIASFILALTERRVLEPAPGSENRLES
jgi:hypothetical protein